MEGKDPKQAQQQANLAQVRAMTDEQFREYMHEFRHLVIDRLIAGELQFKKQQAAIEENTLLTRQGNDAAAELLQVFQITKRGALTLQTIGAFVVKLARWLQPILWVWGALYAIKHGQAPRGEE